MRAIQLPYRPVATPGGHCFLSESLASRPAGSEAARVAAVQAA